MLFSAIAFCKQKFRKSAVNLPLWRSRKAIRYFGKVSTLLLKEVSKVLLSETFEIQGGGRNAKVLNCDHSNESYPEQHFPVVLFIMLFKVVLTFESEYNILKCDHSNESYLEQYFPVVLFIMLYKVPLMYESMDKILLCEKSNYQAVLSYGSVFIMGHKVAQSGTKCLSQWMKSFGFDKV